MSFNVSLHFNLISKIKKVLKQIKKWLKVKNYPISHNLHKDILKDSSDFVIYMWTLKTEHCLMS